MTSKRRPPKKKSAASELSLVLTRIFAAPRELVFAAWTEPTHLKQWSAPRGFTIPVAKGDLRPGGAWRSCMRMPDGIKLWLGGVYREIVPNERLVFTHAWDGDDGEPEHETLVTVHFADHGKGKTKVTLEQSRFASAASRDGHKGGWSECLDRLGEFLEQAQAKGKKS